MLNSYESYWKSNIWDDKVFRVFVLKLNSLQGYVWLMISRHIKKKYILKIKGFSLKKKKIKNTPCMEKFDESVLGFVRNVCFKFSKEGWQSK